MHNRPHPWSYRGQRWSGWRFAGIAAGGLLVLSACASAPPNDALTAAEMAIAEAEQERVADYASPELSAARDKLTAARAEVHKENMERARRLAEEARVSAALAAAKAEAAKAVEVNREMEQSIQILKSELQRNQGGKL